MFLSIYVNRVRIFLRVERGRNMKFVHLTKDEFDSFEEKCPDSTFWQTSAMGIYKEKQGCSLQFVGVKEADMILAASCIIGYPTIGKMYIYHALRGFLIDYTNEDLLRFFVTELKKDLQQQNGIYLHFNPYVQYVQRDKDANLVESGFNNQKIIDTFIDLGCSHKGFSRGFDITTEPRWTMVLDLKDKDAPTLLKEMDQQTRWSINRSLKYPIHVKTLEKKDFYLFKDMLDATSKRRHFDSYPLSYFEDMHDLFGKDTIELVMACLNVEELKESLTKERQDYIDEKTEIEKKLEELPNSKKFTKKLKVAQEGIDLTTKKIQEANELKKQYGSELYLAGAMFVWKNNEAIYLLSASDENLKKFMGPYAIQWRQIRKALDKHMTRYNFYGTSGIFDKSADDYGVYEFKKGFNAHVEELIGDFELVLDKKRNLVYRSMKKAQAVLNKG